MKRECHVRFCERLRVQFPRPTRLDFKIQLKPSVSALSRSQCKKELGAFREKILIEVEQAGFKKESKGITRNERRYFEFRLTYSSSYPASTVLRPHLLLQFTMAIIRLPTQEKMVQTLVQEEFKTLLPHIQGAEINCISIEETAAEKWVALMRRIAATARGYISDDQTLIRHVYDLMMINRVNSLGGNFVKLVNINILQDAEQFKNRHPEFLLNPFAEVTHSLGILKEPVWRRRYEDFSAAMIYDPSPVPSYDEALKTLEEISNQFINRQMKVAKQVVFEM